MDKRKLQRLIDKALSTGDAFKKANDALMDYSRQVYGVEPGDVDADYIIDALGGCGFSGCLSADDFDREMRDRL